MKCPCKICVQLLEAIKSHWRAKFHKKETKKNQPESHSVEKILVNESPQETLVTLMNIQRFPEIRHEILRWLSHESLLTMGQVSSMWRKSTERQLYWANVVDNLPALNLIKHNTSLRLRCPGKWIYVRHKRMEHKWDCVKHQHLISLVYNNQVEAKISEVIATSDGRIVAAYKEDRTIVVWDVNSGKPTARLTIADNPGGVISWLAVTWDNSVVCAAHANWMQPNDGGAVNPCDFVRVWDLANNTCVHVLRHGNPEKIGCMKVCGDRMIYTYMNAVNGHGIAVYNPKEGILINDIKYHNLIALLQQFRAHPRNSWIQEECIVFNGYYIWTRVDEEVRRWRIDENQPDRELRLPAGVVESYSDMRLHSSPNGGLRVVAWQTQPEDGNCVRIIETTPDCRQFDDTIFEKPTLVPNDEFSTWYQMRVRSMLNNESNRLGYSSMTRTVNSIFFTAPSFQGTSVNLLKTCRNFHENKYSIINRFQLDSFVEKWTSPFQKCIMQPTFLVLHVVEWSFNAPEKSRLFVVNLNSD